jgi:hypothetical protein
MVISELLGLCKSEIEIENNKKYLCPEIRPMEKENGDRCS